jgi:hypothetical protein
MRWTEQQVEALRAAMWQLFDDFEEKGTAVCFASKAEARVALEPFIDEDNPAPIYTLEAARKVLKECDG